MPNVKKLLEALRREPSGEMAGGPRPYQALDLVRKTVKHGRAELPILNLAGLWALRRLDCARGDDPAALLKILWVLRHQEEERVLNVEDDPPAPAELAAIGREVDIASLGDYVAALDKMFSLLEKKTPAVTATKG